MSLVPCNDPGVGQSADDRPADMQDLLDVSNLPHLKELARQWVSQSGLRSDNHLEIARLLEHKLGYSGRFQYSLQGEPRDPKLDPIEDFIVNDPRGHCEYFATTLALMLRSQGIPCRVVLGYRTDEWNERGKFYQVRQSYAHAWVEAYLPPRFIPPAMRWGDDDRRWSGGGWLRLDATPPESQSGGNAAARKMQQGLDWLDSLWSDYVMDMDRQRQMEAVYRPALETISRPFRNLFSAAWWRGVLGRLRDLFPQGIGLGGWLLHAGLPLLLLLAAAWLVGRRLGRLMRRLWR